MPLVPSGAVWKYNDTGSDLGTAWRSPAYDETGWASGPAQLGYGDGDEATVVSYGPDSGNKYVTTYFRHTFNVSDPGALNGLWLEVLRDDGAVVYLNGTPIASYSMPATFDYRTYATEATEYAWEAPLSVPISLLVSGNNVLAVEIHQGNASSSDLSLDLRLTGSIDLKVALDSPADRAIGVPVPVTLTATPRHPTGQPTTVTFYGRPTPPPLPDFSIVVLPDIQKYTAQVNGGSVAILNSQIQFILDNRQASNIVYVTQLGDITDNGDFYESEWINASTALYRLESATPEIPYGAAVGNHDQLVPAGDNSPTTYYNQYFGVSHFQGRSYYGGHFGADNNNHYDLFSASGLDFIAIYFEFDSTPDQAVLDWADALLKAYPARRGIVVTHYLLETTAAWGVQGAAIYDALKDNPNLFLMLCGHNHGEARRADTYAGSTVHTLLADYQAYPAGGNGFLRILQFSPSRNAIYARTYSPWLGQYETDENSEFALPYQMITGPAFDQIQQNAGVPSGTSTSATWPGLLPGTRYEWFAQTTDGALTATSELWDFTTSITALPLVTLTSPNDAQVFSDAPYTLTLTATASDPDGSIARVGFFAGSTSLGSDLEAPYQCVATLNTGTYTLTAVATDNNGAQTVSAPARITVGTKPVAPSGLGAASVKRTSVTLTWTDDSGNEDGFGIYQSTDNDSYTLIGTLQPNATTVVITGLTPATSYYYVIRAFNALGYADSTAATVTTPANQAPVAGADEFSTMEDSVLSVVAPGVLANDTDPDSDALSALLVAGPASGTLSLRANGSFDYSPLPNFSGSDTFTYVASDGNAHSETVTVTITVGPINDTPVANLDTATTFAGAKVVINVLANDVDAESSALAVTGVTPGTSGTVTINLDNTVTYRPNAGFTGEDTFTYTITDGTATAVGSVTVTVRPNVLFADGFESANFTAGGWSITGTAGVDVNAKYSGNYGALLKKTSTITKALSGVSATSVQLSYARRVLGLEPGESGYVEVSSDGASWVLVEVPSGTSAWEIKTFDLTLSSPVLWIRFRLNSNEGNDMFLIDDVAVGGGIPPNTAPTTMADSYSLDEDTTLTSSAPGVLANDFDSDDDLLSAVLAVGPTHGSLVVNADGSFSYTPEQNFWGSDTFTYRAADGLAQSDSTTVSITVNPVNDPPVGSGETYSVSQDGQLSVTAPGLLANDTDVDGDTLTITSSAALAHGTAAVIADGSFSYTPTTGYVGPDTFQYTVADGKGGTATATVTINVLRLNHAPAVVDDSSTVSEDSSLTVAAPGVLANDTDADGGVLTAVLVSGPAHGTLQLNPDGSYTYTPNANYSGTDSFTYKANDGLAESVPATVTITVTPVNDLPVAMPDSYTTAQNTTLTVQAVEGVLNNDRDVDADSLTVVVSTGPGSGTLSLSPDGSFTYTPNPGFAGTDTFSYTVSDGKGGTAVATVSIIVEPLSRSMHVASIVVLSQDAGKGLKRGYAEVVVVDANGAPVPAADVTGSFSGDITQSGLVARTGTDGKAVFRTTTTVSGRSPRLTFTVNDLVLSGWIYDSPSNVETSDKNY